MEIEEDKKIETKLSENIESKVKLSSTALAIKSQNIKFFALKRNQDVRLKTEESNNAFHYKNLLFMLNFLTEQRRILPARITDLSKQNQKKVKKYIKILRELGLIAS